MRSSVLFGLLSYAASVACAGVVTPTVGAPPNWAKAMFDVEAKNPDMNDAKLANGAPGADKSPDDWNTNGPLNVFNDAGQGITHFYQGGVLSQALSTTEPEATFNAYWITAKFRTFPLVVHGNTDVVYDPGLRFAWAYQAEPGLGVEDFFAIPGNNPTAGGNPDWKTVDFWGHLREGATPSTIAFTMSMSPAWADSRIDIDYLNFRTGFVDEEMPEPGTLALVTSGCLLALLRRRTGLSISSRGMIRR